MRYAPIVLMAAFLTSCSWFSNEDTGVVERGDFRATLTESGELKAVRYTVVPCPFYSWSYGQATILSLEPEGTLVSEGDVVGVLDTVIVIKALREKGDKRAAAVADLNRLLADQATAMADLDGKIRNAEGQLRKALIDTQRNRFESETRRLAGRLQLRRSELSLRKLRIQRDGLISSQRDERLIKETEIQRLTLDIEKAERTLGQFTLRAPAKGLIEYHRERGEKRKVGDRVWPARVILGLPDMSQMKAMTTIAETDGDKVRVGQKVRVVLDAFPDRSFDGEVTFVSLICRPKERQSPAKVFDVEVLLAETDPILKPGMTISAEIEIANLDDVLLVPGDCLYPTHGGHKVVVRTLFGEKDVAVAFLHRNATHAVIEGDLSEGDRLVRR